MKILPVINWIGGKYHEYLLVITTGEFTFHLSYLLHRCAYFLFIIVISLLIIYNYLYLIFSTCIQDKFINFNDFNKIAKRENSILVLVMPTCYVNIEVSCVMLCLVTVRKLPECYIIIIR